MKEEIDRRHFILDAGKKILIAGSSEIILSQSASAKPKYDLKQLAADTEKQSSEEEDPLPPSKRVGFAVVGLGTLALEQIIPAFGASKKAKLTALVSGHAEKANQIALQNGIARGCVYDYANFDSIKNNPAVDVVYVVLPNSMHAEYTVRAAQAGKHVLCEKPMATSSDDCKKMIEACGAAQKKLMIAYRIQYEPMNRTIVKLAREQRFGAVKMIEATNCQNQGDPTQWRQKKAMSGGGALPDIGIYCLNTIRAMLGEEPVEVFATTYSNRRDPRFVEVEETIAFNLRFPSGILANCMSSYAAHESRCYRVFAEKGWFGMDPAFAYDGLQVQVSHAQGDCEYTEYPKITAKNQFAAEMDHLADCVLQNRQPRTPGEEGLQDQKIMEALYTSASQRLPIKLAEVKQLDAFRGPEILAR